ncbi:VanZ family protein [Streptomyces sp. LaPpAH-108]|uniref:VanZ family protein n=1 Tax=Streptomyces sp. LaPpAH-108 TaxID=1155714 RepID=UPI00036D9D87|nr:VanZ family protein [Streptomyces sp. LaPpAH-108]
MTRTAPRLPAALRLPRRGERPERKAKAGRTRASGKTKRTATAAKARRTSAPAKAGRANLLAKFRRTSTPAKAAKPAGPRPLPLPLRLPIMLLAFVFMVAFAILLARVTLEPSPASVALTHSNLHPGNSLRAYLDYASVRDVIRQLGGNILLGVPFGVLVPVLAPRARGVLQVLALTALVMLMVELTQGALITGRAFDIDDVILNTTGSLLGWALLGRRLGRAVHARRVREPADA